jgi:hypothetical protein
MNPDDISKYISDFEDDISAECYRIICELRWYKSYDKETAYYAFNEIIRDGHIKKWNKRFKAITNQIISDYGGKLSRQKWILRSYCGFSFKDKFDMLWKICGPKPKWLNTKQNFESHD